MYIVYTFVFMSNKIVSYLILSYLRINGFGAVSSGTSRPAPSGTVGESSNGAASNGTVEKYSIGTAGAASSGTAGIASSGTAEVASSGTQQETCSWMSLVSEGITKNMEDV